MDPSRRKFLKQSAIAASTGCVAGQLPPIQTLLKLFLGQTLKQAHANVSQANINYLVFYFNGAPGRWTFDHFLKTTNQQSISNNASVATQLTGDGQSYSAAEYATIDYHGMTVPPLWQTAVKTRTGGQRPLVDLLPHLICFRGYGTGIDGHLGNSATQTNPVPSAGSITGHVADHSKTLFRALQAPVLGGWSGYQSVRSTGLTLIPGYHKSNYLANLLSPFTPRDDSAFINALTKKSESAVAEVYKQFRFIASNKYDGLGPLDLDYRGSYKKLQTGIEDLESSWTNLYSKYETIILNTIKDRTIPGFSDRPIIAKDDATFDMMVIDKTLRPTIGTDLRDWLNSVDCDAMISAFALAEFVVTRGYSNVVELGELFPVNLKGYFTSNMELKTFFFQFDQHTMGVVPATFLNGMLFRAFGGALLELIDQLKATGKFESTFIHLVQEFGRTARDDGSGSDHGFDAMIGSVFTGANSSGPIVVGNIARSSTPGLYAGTWGESALTRVGADYVSLTPAHVASTLANLMQLEVNPWANTASPLITRSGSSLITLASGDIV
jgi:hypothetical protein